MNSHSFSTFANTISFNVSRYPTPVEITESKNYSEPEKHVGDREDAEKGVKDLDLTSNVPPATGGGGSDVFMPGSTVCDSSNIEYVPAEYFRGVPTAHLVQSGKMFLYSIILVPCQIFCSCCVKICDKCEARSSCQRKNLDAYDADTININVII